MRLANQVPLRQIVILLHTRRRQEQITAVLPPFSPSFRIQPIPGVFSFFRFPAAMSGGIAMPRRIPKTHQYVHTPSLRRPDRGNPSIPHVPEKARQTSAIDYPTEATPRRYRTLDQGSWRVLLGIGGQSVL